MKVTVNARLDDHLDIGSRHIREVEPLDLEPELAMGTWSCARCRVQHPVEDSQAVYFDSKGQRLLFVVCQRCAELYRVPAPVLLDLTKLPPPDHADQRIRSVTAHAWFVSNARARPPKEVLRLRDADVRELAKRSRETPEILVRRLADRGLLATA